MASGCSNPAMPSPCAGSFPSGGHSKPTTRRTSRTPAFVTASRSSTVDLLRAYLDGHGLDVQHFNLVTLLELGDEVATFLAFHRQRARGAVGTLEGHGVGLGVHLLDHDRGLGGRAGT